LSRDKDASSIFLSKHFRNKASLYLLPFFIPNQHNTGSKGVRGFNTHISKLTVNWL